MVLRSFPRAVTVGFQSRNSGALEPAVGLQSSINYLPFSVNNDGQGEPKAKRFPARGCLYLCGTSVKPRPAIS